MSNEKAREFVNNKLGDKNYTHSPYCMHREEIAEWLQEYADEFICGVDEQWSAVVTEKEAENASLKERVMELEIALSEEIWFEESDHGIPDDLMQKHKQLLTNNQQSDE